MKLYSYFAVLAVLLLPAEGKSTIRSKSFGNYDYGEVLRQSLLFYEAQRSGKLPLDNRIDWRGDSALNDGSDVGVDLTGGYYDAGDFVKFGFPAAQAMTMLAWGGIVYKDAYEAAGQFDYLLDAVKWGMDYCIKCHVSDNEFYGQVGDGYVDNNYWGRPEEMTMLRPAAKIDISHPGSDLAGETAAAFASASILFQGMDDDYSATLLDHAKTLYNFADKYRGKYSDNMPEAADFYTSYDYNDELIWGALWLYKASGESEYLTKAKSYWEEVGGGGMVEVFSWDDKWVAIDVLLIQETGDSKYKAPLQKHCDSAVSGQERSPQGELIYYGWGSLRYAANAAFVCLQAASLIDGKEDAYTGVAVDQMDYILGKLGHSFVVGFGENYPKQPHHSASSCPDLPATCDWDDFDAPGPNPQVLYGALVGGPDAPDDQWSDNRQDYVECEVTLDYNAGFQSTIAGLLSAGLKKL